jgi:hypothetical protein
VGGGDDVGARVGAGVRDGDDGTRWRGCAETVGGAGRRERVSVTMARAGAGVRGQCAARDDVGARVGAGVRDGDDGTRWRGCAETVRGAGRRERATVTMARAGAGVRRQWAARDGVETRRRGTATMARAGAGVRDDRSGRGYDACPVAMGECVGRDCMTAGSAGTAEEAREGERARHAGRVMAATLDGGWEAVMA